jgi:hypothetical protein
MADDNEFGPLFRAAVEQHVAAMSNEDFAKLTALRPPTDAASTRRSIGAKAQQLWDTPRDANGALGGWAAAAKAREPQPQPTVETPQFRPPPDTGYTGYTGSDSLRRTPFVTPITTTTAQIR